MNRAIASIISCLLAVWYVLLNRCWILTSGMPLAGDIGLLLILQVCAGTYLLSIIFGRSTPSASRSLRINLVVFVLPSIFFLISPVIISEVLNRERYGTDKFVIHAHMARDFGCCVNPLSSWATRPPSPSGSN
jgi:hypothetical protein